MKKLEYINSMYQTTPNKVSLFARAFPSLTFYSKFIATVFKASAKAKRGEYNEAEWSHSCFEVLDSLEKVGVNFEISGINYLQELKEPCVIIGNHMSVMETVVLPLFIQPTRDVTYIVKQSLLDYPVFKHVMRSREPIAVTRTNPRQDLKTVIEDGQDRLRRGISIIVFPQTTRTTFLDPKQFTTLGIKLAQKSGVPIIPVALVTDAWGNGKRMKDFGKIDPSKTVRFAFGEPIWVKERGAEQHQQVIDFISGKLNEWRN